MPSTSRRRVVVVQAGPAPDVVPGIARDQAWNSALKSFAPASDLSTQASPSTARRFGEAAAEVVVALRGRRGRWSSAVSVAARRARLRRSSCAAARPPAGARRRRRRTRRRSRRRRSRHAGSARSSVRSRPSLGDRPRRRAASSACASALPSVGASSAAAASANTVPRWRSMLARMRAGVDLQPGAASASATSAAVRREEQRRPFGQLGLPVAEPALVLLRHRRQQRGYALRRALRRGQRDHRRDRVALVRHRRRAAAAGAASAPRPRRPRLARAARGRARSCRASRTAAQLAAERDPVVALGVPRAPGAGRPSRRPGAARPPGPCSPSDASVPTAPPSCSCSAAARPAPGARARAPAARPSRRP